MDLMHFKLNPIQRTFLITVDTTTLKKKGNEVKKKLYAHIEISNMATIDCRLYAQRCTERLVELVEGTEGMKGNKKLCVLKK